jgi:hypothetical protein
MEPGTQDAMTAARSDQSNAPGRRAERRKTQRRTPPPEISDSGSYRVDDRRLCRGRRWDDWRRN